MRRMLRIISRIIVSLKALKSCVNSSNWTNRRTAVNYGQHTPPPFRGMQIEESEDGTVCPLVHALHYHMQCAAPSRLYAPLGTAITGYRWRLTSVDHYEVSHKTDSNLPARTVKHEPQLTTPGPRQDPAWTSRGATEFAKFSHRASLRRRPKL